VLDTGERIGLIESLSVLPAWRGRAIGHRLIERAHGEFATLGIDNVALTVFAENADAIRFYEAHGMVPAANTYRGRIARTELLRGVVRG
jgi:ribosomal protein S18 acetylase RimI-like enzyme